MMKGIGRCNKRSFDTKGNAVLVELWFQQNSDKRHRAEETRTPSAGKFSEHGASYVKSATHSLATHLLQFKNVSLLSCEIIYIESHCDQVEFN